MLSARIVHSMIQRMRSYQQGDRMDQSGSQSSGKLLGSRKASKVSLLSDQAESCSIESCHTLGSNDQNCYSPTHVCVDRRTTQRLQPMPFAVAVSVCAVTLMVWREL